MQDGTAPWDRPARRRRGVVALALLAVVGVAGLLRPAAEQPSQLSVNDGTVAGEPVSTAPGGSWELLRPSPVSWIARPALLWTGREVLAWGPTRTGTAGAVYDPSGGAWRTMAEAPLSARTGAMAVWAPEGLPAAGTGELIVWGGQAVEVSAGRWPADGAAYDPASDTWRMLPAAPLSPQVPQAAVWTGTDMLVVVGRNTVAGNAVGAFHPEAAAYDPARDRWRQVPEPPAAVRALVWSGLDAIAISAAGKVAGWRPGLDEWHRYPDVPVRLGPGMTATASEAEVALWTDQAPVLGRERLLLLEVDDRRWREAAPPSLEQRGHALVTGDGTVTVWGGRPVPAVDTPARAAVFDARTAAWSLLTDPMQGREPPAAVWTGRGLFVLDGVNGRAAAWRPAGTAPTG